MSSKLVIFDCDGVLVDTEHITGAFFQRYLLDQGMEDPNGEALYRYRGFSLAGAIEDLESRIGKKVHETFIDDFRQETMAAMASDLRAIEGVHDALTAISIAKCVASNGPLIKMQLTLKVTGLRKFFGDALFSAYEIKKWKPEPDLFLHAATTMKVDPQRCVVVEDSVHGALAAVAAGMPVFAFAQPHEAEPFQEAGAHCFSKMAELPALISSL
jgi:HAD superfamily hydrolase (TIGR01509 family)